MAGGRPKGSLNANTEHLQSLCNYYDFDPAEILIHIARNDWQALGYESPNTTKVTKEGAAIEVERIELSDRHDAAKNLMSYLFPKRRTVDLKSSDGLTPLILAYNTETKKPEETK